MQLLTAQKTLREFRQKVKVNFERGHYRIKTVDSAGELEQVFRLRYEVFHREFMNKKLPFGVDVDRFDPSCDHLIIIDKRSERVVGTYRFLSTLLSPCFYSETEFCLYEFLSRPGTKLELSRACIHRDYRTGQVMHLLWRGLVEYLRHIGAKYLFGCASIKTMSTREAALVYRYLGQIGALRDNLHIHPLQGYRIEGFLDEIERCESEGEMLSEEELKEAVPPLFGAYLRAGAKVYGTPAIDRDFRCIDFLTVLDMSDLTRSFERKYVSG